MNVDEVSQAAVVSVIARLLIYSFVAVPGRKAMITGVEPLALIGEIAIRESAPAMICRARIPLAIHT